MLSYKPRKYLRLLREEEMQLILKIANFVVPASPMIIFLLVILAPPVPWGFAAVLGYIAVQAVVVLVIFPIIGHFLRDTQ